MFLPPAIDDDPTEQILPRKGGKARVGGDRERGLQFSADLDALHLQACQEVSGELRSKLASLEARLAALMTGPASFPQSVTLVDMLPQWSSAEEKGDLDAELLSSDLPIDAYVDRGFQNWLSTSHEDN